MFVTGTRADFGKIKEVAARLARKGWKVSFFVTGMHMLEKYGATYLEVRRVEGATTYEFVNQRDDDPLDLVFAKTVLGFSDWVREANPDLVIIHGDRVEANACAFVCATNYIRCLHIEGGEVSGTIDEVFRHCVTKLAHHHFVCSKGAVQNILALGEDKNRIVLVGSPELDIHKRQTGPTIDEVKNYYNINFDEYGIVIFHPVTSEIHDMGTQAEHLFSALTASGKNFVVISANNDPGTHDIMNALNKLDKTHFHMIPSMRFEYFSVLMKHAAAMIGNSSAGVREVPFVGVPSLNVGTRQNGRARAKSITHVSADDKDAISVFFADEWGKRYPGETEFGDGDSVSRFVMELENESFWEIPLQKFFIHN